jgi:hypothetical protein
MKVTSIVLSSPIHHICRHAMVVILKVTMYSVVPLVDLHWTSDALHYHLLQGTNNMSIPSLFVILLKMTVVNTTVISVKKNETRNIGSITVQIAVFLLIPNVFLGNTQMSRNKIMAICLKVLTFDCHPHPLTLIEETKDYPQCHSSSCICKELIYQCAQCNFNMHYYFV